MAFNHRKMLVSYLPDKDLNLTIFIPCFQKFSPPPPPPLPPQNDFSLFVLITICAAGSVLLFVFLIGFFYHYITKPSPSSAASVASHNTNEEEDEERNFSDFHHVWRINTVGLHRSVIDSITVVVFKKEEGKIDSTECSVCLNEFEEDESLRLLPKCSHAFHINCIDTWLLSHKNCPLCRAPVLHTDPTHQVTETNHLQDSESNNDLTGGQESSEARNSNILSRAQSDLTNHCGQGRIENVRRSYSIGGSLSRCDGDNIEIRNRSHFNTRFFSSSRR